MGHEFASFSHLPVRLKAYEKFASTDPWSIGL